MPGLFLYFLDQNGHVAGSKIISGFHFGQESGQDLRNLAFGQNLGSFRFKLYMAAEKQL
ncbi:hypothetical protein D3C74_455270 [compost metagenome]